MFKIGFEQYNENTGAVIQRQRIHLGGNLRLESQTGMVRNYELISAVCHTGHTGDSANLGHFNSFLKKTTTLQEHPWNLYNDSNPILMRPASSLETCDIFLYIQVDEYL